MKKKKVGMINKPNPVTLEKINKIDKRLGKGKKSTK